MRIPQIHDLYNFMTPTRVSFFPYCYNSIYFYGGDCFNALDLQIFDKQNSIMPSLMTSHKMKFKSRHYNCLSLLKPCDVSCTPTRFLTCQD